MKKTIMDIFDVNDISLSEQASVLKELIGIVEEKFKVYKPIADIIQSQAADLDALGYEVLGGEYNLDAIIIEWNGILDIDRCSDKIHTAINAALSKSSKLDE